jgi:hypothetical protein
VVFVSIAAFLGWNFGRHAERQALIQRSYLSGYDAAVSGNDKGCENLSGEMKFNCLVERSVDNLSLDKTELDLIAQQDMAEYAFWALAISSISTVVAFGGIFFVFQSLMEARKASVVAMRGVEATWRTGQAQIRAYISVTDVEMNRNEDDIGIKFAFLNSGNSPARSLAMRWTARLRNMNNRVFIFPIGEGMGSFGDVRADSGEEPHFSHRIPDDTKIWIGHQSVVELIIHFEYFDVVGEHQPETFVYFCPIGSLNADFLAVNPRPFYLGGNDPTQ